MWKVRSLGSEVSGVWVAYRLQTSCDVTWSCSYIDVLNFKIKAQTNRKLLCTLKLKQTSDGVRHKAHLWAENLFLVFLNSTISRQGAKQETFTLIDLSTRWNLNLSLQTMVFLFQKCGEKKVHQHLSGVCCYLHPAGPVTEKCGCWLTLYTNSVLAAPFNSVNSF